MVKRKQPDVGPPVDPSEFLAATAVLAVLHPEVTSANEERRNEMLSNCGAGAREVLDSVVSTMLSQNTTDKNAHAAFDNLKANFPTWTSVMTARPSEIEACIKVAGLSATRTERIQALLTTLASESDDGSPSLEYLRSYNDAAVKKDLLRFKGMGPKTVSCVLLFALARAEFPVDTHVLRISKQQKWVGSGATRESAYESMNAIVPAAVKMDLHCLLVRHGKVCKRCAANGKPQFPPETPFACPLANIAKVVDNVVVKEEVVTKVVKKIKQETE